MYHYRAAYRSNYDGDTIRLDIDLGFGIWARNQIVRLYGVDTPELRGETLAEGHKARTFVYDALSSAGNIEIKTYKDSKGKYGRWLAEVWYDGICLNEELVLVGLADMYHD